MVLVDSMDPRVAVLWTGGKDSALALYRAADRGARICALITFVPSEKADFQAHPLATMQVQAEQLGIEHRKVSISEPYREGYIAALSRVRDDFSVSGVVTGDIDLVNGMPNWIKECSTAIDLDVLTPLWHNDREALLWEVVDRGLVAAVSWINDNSLPAQWLGRTIDAAFIHDIVALAARTGIDICGENGEYHTMCRVLPQLRQVAR
jgi:diphthine-ammonia ligase